MRTLRIRSCLLLQMILPWQHVALQSYCYKTSFKYFYYNVFEHFVTPLTVIELLGRA